MVKVKCDCLMRSFNAASPNPIPQRAIAADFAYHLHA